MPYKCEVPLRGGVGRRYRVGDFLRRRCSLDRSPVVPGWTKEPRVDEVTEGVLFRGHGEAGAAWKASACVEMDDDMGAA